MMGAKSTIIALLMALLAVGAMVICIRRDFGGPVFGRPGRPEALLSSTQLPVDDVTMIILRRGEEPRMVFERRGGEWWQSEPFAHPMDPYSIRQLAILARDLEVMGTLPESGEEAPAVEAIGLKPPAAFVEFRWSSGQLGLELGRRSVGGRAYLRRVGDQQVRVVANRLHDRALDMDPKEWRDRTIFRRAGVESDRIEWSIGQERIVIERDRRQWRMLEPVRTRVDPINRDILFQDLGRAQAAGFILDQPQDLSRFGLQQPVLTMAVTVSTGAKATSASASAPSATDVQRLLVGNRVGANTQDRFAMIEGRPTVFRLAAASIAAMFRQPRDLVEPTGSGANPADVKSLVIRAAGGELRLERDLERWRASSHGGAVVEAALVQEVLEQVTRLRAPQVDLKPYPREFEVGTITLHGYDGRAIDTVRVAHEKDSGRWALENGDDVLRVFPPGLELRMTAEDFGLRGEG